MPLLLSSTLTSNAACATLGTFTGTGTLPFDTDKGVQLTATNMLKWSNVAAGSSSTTWFVRFELEAKAIFVDESRAGSVEDSTNAAQAARSVVARILYLYSTGYGNQIFSWFNASSGNTSCQFNHFVGAGASTNKFFNYYDRMVDRRHTSADGTVQYTKFVIGVNAAKNQITAWINGMLVYSATALAGFDFTNVLRNLELNNNTLPLGDGTNNYWARNLEVWVDEDYDPIVHEAPVNRKKTIKLAMAPSSFELTALDINAPYGLGNILKATLAREYGIDCQLISGLEANGRGYNSGGNSLNSTHINSVLAQGATDIILFATPNDLTDTQNTWAGGTYNDWENAVENAFINCAAGTSVQRLYPASMWCWMNAASSAGFGGTNTRAQAHWSNPSNLVAMNKFFSKIKTNPDIPPTTNNKIMPYLDVQKALGADKFGKGYPREFTIGSFPSTPDNTNLHPAPRQHILLAEYLAPVIANAVAGSSGLYNEPSNFTGQPNEGGSYSRNASTGALTRIDHTIS